MAKQALGVSNRRSKDKMSKTQNVEWQMLKKQNVDPTKSSMTRSQVTPNAKSLQDSTITHLLYFESGLNKLNRDNHTDSNFTVPLSS